MEKFKSTIEELLRTGGLHDASLDINPETHRITIFSERMNFKDLLPKLIADAEHVFNLIARKHNVGNFVVDINNYRREREHLIIELAKAAARKALLQKAEIALPPMNAYERRLIHMELASRPDLKTESSGEGKHRHVIITPISE